jgi:tRNA A37 N6-isopentenylltransferase MiaA
MKTLLECKYEAIKQLGFAYSWEYQTNEATRPELIEVMDLAATIYAKSCAEQYLRDAIKNLNEDSRVKTVLCDNDVAIMVSTPIVTP